MQDDLKTILATLDNLAYNVTFDDKSSSPSDCDGVGFRNTYYEESGRLAPIGFSLAKCGFNRGFFGIVLTAVRDYKQAPYDFTFFKNMLSASGELLICPDVSWCNYFSVIPVYDDINAYDNLFPYADKPVLAAIKLLLWTEDSRYVYTLAVMLRSLSRIYRERYVESSSNEYGKNVLDNHAQVIANSGWRFGVRLWLVRALYDDIPPRQLQSASVPDVAKIAVVKDDTLFAPGAEIDILRATTDVEKQMRMVIDVEQRSARMLDIPGKIDTKILSVATWPLSGARRIGQVAVLASGSAMNIESITLLSRWLLTFCFHVQLAKSVDINATTPTWGELMKQHYAHTKLLHVYTELVMFPILAIFRVQQESMSLSMKTETLSALWQSLGLYTPIPSVRLLPFLRLQKWDAKDMESFRTRIMQMAEACHLGRYSTLPQLVRMMFMFLNTLLHDDAYMRLVQQLRLTET